MKLFILFTLAFIMQNYDTNNNIPVLKAKSVIKENILLTEENNTENNNNKLQRLVYDCLKD